MRGRQSVGHTISVSLEACDLATRAEAAFEEWWLRDGQFLDPDTSDVPWFDKRKELCGLAFLAAMAQSRNYTADTAISPTRVTFANGRIVLIKESQ